MKRLVQNNTRFQISEFTESHESLPIGNYVVKFSEEIGFFLQQQENFQLPKKLYGDFSFIDRWKTSYLNNVGKNLGILLSGTKGTGKTIAAQKFCVEMNMPVIFITKSFFGPSFEAFLTDPLFTDCIIFIDEYEKVYSEDEDEDDKLLTVLDGLYQTRMIFLFTVNDSSKISDKLVNRLNRIKYHRVFEELDAAVIEGIIDDMLVNTSLKSTIYDFINKFGFITPDILITLIKEMNLFNESALDCASYLNLCFEERHYYVYCRYKDDDFYLDYENINPLTDKFIIPNNHLFDGKDNDPEYEELKTWLRQKPKIFMPDFVYSRTKKGYEIIISDNIKIILKESVKPTLAF